MKDALNEAAPLDVVHYDGERAAATTAALVTEAPFTIVANGVELATLPCSPTNLRDLTTGCLFTAGFIDSLDEIRALDIDSSRLTVSCTIARDPGAAPGQRRTRAANDGTAGDPDSLEEPDEQTVRGTGPTLAATQVHALAQWLQHCSALYRRTHAVHTAGLSVGGAPPCIVADDIGRHNAVDKVIGAALAGRTDFANSALLSSGRTSSEILRKVYRARIPLIIARGAPTRSAVLEARRYGMTIVGRARGASFTVYSCPERIVSDSRAPRRSAS